MSKVLDKKTQCETVCLLPFSAVWFHIRQRVSTKCDGTFRQNVLTQKFKKTLNFSDTKNPICSYFHCHVTALWWPKRKSIQYYYFVLVKLITQVQYCVWLEIELNKIFKCFKSYGCYRLFDVCLIFAISPILRLIHYN